MSLSFNTSRWLIEFSPSLTGFMKIRVGIIAWAEYPMMKLDVDAADSLDRVRATIEREKGIPAPHQKFILKGKILEGSRQLSEYNIQDYQILQCAVKHPDDRSRRVGCEACIVYFSEVHYKDLLELCGSCAVNNALRPKFDPTDYGPPAKKQRRLS